MAEEKKGLAFTLKNFAVKTSVNIAAMVIFGSAIMVNLAGGSSTYVLVVSALFCLWAFIYLRAKSSEINLDWFYVVLPLIYAVFDLVKERLRQPGELQDYVVGVSLGVLSTLIMVPVVFWTFRLEGLKALAKEEKAFIVCVLLIMCGLFTLICR